MPPFRSLVGGILFVFDKSENEDSADDDDAAAATASDDNDDDDDDGGSVTFRITFMRNIW